MGMGQMNEREKGTDVLSTTKDVCKGLQETHQFSAAYAWVDIAICRKRRLLNEKPQCQHGIPLYNQKTRLDFQKSLEDSRCLQSNTGYCRYSCLPSKIRGQVHIADDSTHFDCRMQRSSSLCGLKLLYTWQVFLVSQATYSSSLERNGFTSTGSCMLQC